MVDLFLGYNVVQWLVGLQLDPRYVRVVLEFCSHFGDLRIGILLPNVIFSQLTGESVKLLRLKCYSNHEHFAIVHFSELLDSTVIKSSTIAYSVAVVHEAHQRNDEHLWINLLLVFLGLVNAEKFTLDQFVAWVVLTEHQGLLLFFNDRQRIYQIQLSHLHQLLHNWIYVELKGDWTV
mgnify:FL=1